MAPATGTGLGSPKAAFRTHLNYLRCMRRLLSSADLSLSVTGTPPRRNHEVSRFRKLLDLTRKSIQADITLARADPTFAVVVTPWFPVKCYYSLYYLESILIHLIDGSTSGFGKGGHAGVRKSLCRLIGSGVVSLGTAQLNRSYKLTEVQALPAIASGRNTHPDYWREAQCVDSLAKKLMEYKLHDAKLGKHWNLHKLKHRAEQAEYIQRESL